MEYATWRKSTRSASQSNCVEVAAYGAVRDSKNPDGPVLRVDLSVFLPAMKSGRFDR
jgi:Domain of unknown function (DUF397)